jgi:DNA-directed RNA polymerase specialized sigma24 family protein
MAAAKRQPGARWIMSRESFATLLLKLGDDPFEAGARYEALRSRLIRYFMRRCLDFPEDLADNVLDRLTRRLAEGSEIDSLEGFALGIARHVAMEQAAKPFQVLDPDGTFFYNISADLPTPDEDEKIARMEQCLKCLAAEDLALLEGYYLSEGSQISARKAIADDLGTSLGSIRQRIFFIRRKLRQCIERRTRNPGL